jgi:DNA-binding transcriptional LysR family regulator
MELDLVKLRTLAEIRATGSMTAAAARLGYTTGAVSQQMAALERAVRTPLFVQVGRRLRLTDAGALLAEHARELLTLAQQAEDDLAALSTTPRADVLVGVFGTAAAAFLPRALQLLARTHPGVRLRSIEVDVDAATSAVAVGDVDLAFGIDYLQAPAPRNPDVSLRVLHTERFAMATALDRAGPSAVASLADFAEQAWVLPPEATFYGQAMRVACRRAGFEPMVGHTVTDTASTLSLVAAGVGVAPVTDLMLALRRDGLATTALREPLERVLVLAHRSHPAPQPGVLAVITAVQQSMTTTPSADDQQS